MAGFGRGAASSSMYSRSASTICGRVLDHGLSGRRRVVGVAGGPYGNLGVTVADHFWCRRDLRGDVLAGLFVLVAGLFVLVLLVGHDSISIGCGCWAACG